MQPQWWRTFSATLAGLALLCGCDPAFEPGCADEFIEGRLTFPDGTESDVCTPMRPGGFIIGFASPLNCDVVAAAAAGDSPTDGSWSVGGNDAWFGTTGRKELWVFFFPNATFHPSLCGDDPAHCGFRNPCQFEVSRRATEVGEMVEATLAEECLLGDPSTPGTPTLRSMRVRGRITAGAVNDAGVVCSYRR
jgi:hypothetical protein